MREAPDRSELGRRYAAIRFEPVALSRRSVGGLHLAGAWQVTSSDRRFGGVSALALAANGFVALTDSGVFVRFPRPGARSARAVIGELPGGPGDRRFKFNRDSEALVFSRSQRGWWVGFENRNELWLYDFDFRRAVKRVSFGRGRWPRNRGMEAAGAGDEGTLLLLPEQGKSVIEMRGSSAREVAIHKSAERISDAARLPTGELLVVNRRLTLLGFSNSIATLQRMGNGYRYGRRVRLRLGRLDNVEAMAPELLANGSVRLWLMTDDNYQRPFRTLLIAVDLPSRPQPQRPLSSRSRV